MVCSNYKTLTVLTWSGLWLYVSLTSCLDSWCVPTRPPWNRPLISEDMTSWPSRGSCCEGVCEWPSISSKVIIFVPVGAGGWLWCCVMLCTDTTVLLAPECGTGTTVLLAPECGTGTTVLLAPECGTGTAVLLTVECGTGTTLLLNSEFNGGPLTDSVGEDISIFKTSFRRAVGSFFPRLPPSPVSEMVFLLFFHELDSEEDCEDPCCLCSS